jgi:hypothetical protein
MLQRQRLNYPVVGESLVSQWDRFLQNGALLVHMTHSHRLARQTSEDVIAPLD